MSLSDRCVNTLAAWLNGDIEHCWMGEHLGIESAVVDGQSVVILFVPTTSDEIPFRARFALTNIEIQPSARLRQNQAHEQDT